MWALAIIRGCAKFLGKKRLKKANKQTHHSQVLELHVGNLQTKLEEKSSDLEDKIDKSASLAAELKQYKDDYKKVTQEVSQTEF